MPVSSPASRRSRRSLGLRILAFGLLVLGFCVFAWGLRYKLSLYDPPHSVTHRMPAAKLLPGPKRDAIVAPAHHRTDPPAPAMASLALIFASFLLLAAKLRARFSSRLFDPPPSRLLLQFSGGGTLFVRPPPASL